MSLELGGLGLFCLFLIYIFLSGVSTFPIQAFSSQVSIGLSPDAIGEKAVFTFSSLFCDAIRS